jgi:DNA helicase-2/ATP-dependent DNA helicase PcrA
MQFCETADVIREELVNLDIIKKSAKSHDESMIPFIFGKYLELLQSKHLIDFSGILFECYNLLHDKEILQRVRQSAEFLVCDEFQDVNTIQESIINLIWGESGNICVVGDDDQSIYHWRGTKPDYLINFERRYSSTSTYTLSENFRCSQRIAAVASSIISRNPQSRRIDKKMISRKPDQTNAISARLLDDEEEEAKFIVDTIMSMIGKQAILPDGSSKTLDYHDFAVLFRSVRGSAKAVIHELESRQIPFEIRGDTGDLFDRHETDFVMKCFAYLSDLQYKDKDYGLAELKLGLQKISDNKKTLSEFENKISQIKACLSTAKTLDLQRIFHSILNAIGVPCGIYSDPVMAALGQISELIREFEDMNYPIRPCDIKFFMGFVEGFALNDFGANPTSVRALEEENAVTVSTIHRAKGLQFAFVLIPRVNEKLFPTLSRSLQILLPHNCYAEKMYEGSVEDERRLFYVALTRSIAYLSVSATKTIRQKDRAPSQFYLEFKETLDRIATMIQPLQSTGTAKPVSKRIMLSPSTVELYLECPYRYKLTHILQFSPGIDQAIGFGKQAHFLIEYLFKTSNNKPPSSARVSQIVDKNFYLRYAYGRAHTNLRDGVKRYVTNYVRKFDDDFRRYMTSEEQFYMEFDSFDYTGIADLLLRTNGESVEIIDFKTEVAPMDKSELQLISYAEGMRVSHGYNVSDVSAHFLKDNRREHVVITSQGIKRFRQSIEETAHNISNKNFPFTNDVTICNKCDFVKFCPRPEVGGLSRRP